MTMWRYGVAVMVILCLVTVTVPGADWTRFRGPNGDGVVEDAAVPLTWTAKDITWTARLPGRGHSSPVVQGERVFVTCSDSKGKRIVVCLSLADGKELWKHETAGSKYRTHKKNSFATSTPAVDAERVYVTWATPKESVVMALDHSGKEVWKKDLGPYRSQHGWGVSPIVHDGMVIVVHQPDGDGNLFALEAKTGKVRWKIPRQGKNATYSTPCIFAPKGRAAELIFTNWQHGITGVDAAKGKVDWEISVFDTKSQQRAIPSPVVAGDLIVGASGFYAGIRRLVVIKPGSNGTKAKEVWQTEEAVSQMSTPLVRGDRMLMCNENGIATWFDVKSGKVIWRKRIGGVYHASPVCVGERMYCTSTDGKVVVLQASDTFKLLATNDVGGATQATPAVANGRLLFRLEQQVVCVGGKK